jgi:hypothetical protein
MYANGLTKGVSATRFGIGFCDANMYAAFLLRALGYDDGETADRQSASTGGANGALSSADDALARAHAIGLLSDEHLSRLHAEDFLRGDLAVLSLRALFTERKDAESHLIDRLVSEKTVAESVAKRYKDILEAAKSVSRGFFLSEEAHGYESHLVETYSLAEAGYAPISTDRYISDAKGESTDAGWREIAHITELSQDSKETYTVYSTADWQYYDFGDGTRYKTPAAPSDEEEPTALSGLFGRCKSAAIEEKDGKTIIREEMSDEIAEKRAKKLVSYLFGTDDALFDELSDDDYGLRLRGCTDTYTLDAEGYVLQWTESIEFYFQFRMSLRENPPYLIVSDTVADYSNHGRPVEVVFPEDLDLYPARL